MGKEFLAVICQQGMQKIPGLLLIRWPSPRISAGKMVSSKCRAAVAHQCRQKPVKAAAAERRLSCGQIK
ncbi:hypothetical protein ADH70_002745 [Blautia pseudococcoides]|uniref:Uncharacterized protein n=1 Tax=Blautia pseudococcoides TaxID=1796616 RepID=A0A1C7I955_9FIRM|nr:hypothetical protein A4V09_04410 [Blautia pseudococcoides]ASU27879.1 hypothetical protein ADH70_002745 [Blautia pseudococcoides]